MSVLYHASTNKGLKLIKPKRTLSHDKYIGDYVFATSDERLAAMYLATRGTPTLMNSQAKTPTIVIQSDQAEYLKNDTGGAIYTVSAETFEKTPQEGLEESEVVSKQSVKPIDKTVYTSSIEAIRQHRIKMYFVDKQAFDQLVATKDEGKILTSLTPYQCSEQVS